ncbi:hypothetical protein SY86_09185 [Erwinia tracheiphila]|nr:l-lysine 6-monooxygenase (lysine n(6)-hydroxylase) protein [Erwinia tracheiphila PSU-1]KKF37795.1 hypothetical protein SY86_09185 [Erwinia tracheiphila]
MGDFFKETDVVCIGLGPFNLSLSVLLHEAGFENYIAIEQKESFSWHEGMLLEGTTLQVPFLADLSTMVNPRSEFTYLNYLHEKNRLQKFFFFEDFKVPRREYNNYCQWACEKIKEKIIFDCAAISIKETKTGFAIQTSKGKIYTRKIVIGIGTVPYTPECVKQNKNIIHSSDFYKNQCKIKKNANITILGSGQSSAEIFKFLFNEQMENGKKKYFLNWLTRSQGLFQMEYSKFGLEFSSLDHTKFFYHGHGDKKKLVKSQAFIYKGISYSTISDIYNALYHRDINNDIDNYVLIHPFLDLIEIEQKNNIIMKFKNTRTEQNKTILTDYLICCTGYKYEIPAFLDKLKNKIKLTDKETIDLDFNYKVKYNGDGTIYVQNMEINTHGLTSPDLGYGAIRASIIANDIIGKHYYIEQKNNIFQNFD